jgi:hypothetical protein
MTTEKKIELMKELDKLGFVVEAIEDLDSRKWGNVDQMDEDRLSIIIHKKSKQK